MQDDNRGNCNNGCGCDDIQRGNCCCNDNCGCGCGCGSKKDDKKSSSTKKK